MARAFVDLRVYALAAEVGDELSRVVATWPSFERWSVGMQLMRATDSIAANIAEASGRWVKRARARGLPIEIAGEHLSDLGRMLSGLIRRPSPR
jgi:hypothetical protein